MVIIMEDIKQYEAAVIRRVCYMVNAFEINAETLSESFYFTNQLSFDKWYDTNKSGGWVLSSFYRLFSLFSEKAAEKERLTQQVLIPACEEINQVIDSQNEKLKYFFSDQFFIDNAIEALTQNGYSYDYAQRQAKTFVSDPKYRNQIEENIKKQIIEPFEATIKSMNVDFDIDIAKHWSPTLKKYNHITPDDITYLGGAKTSVKNDALGMKGVTVKSFFEYQYVLAIGIIVKSIDVRDAELDSVISSARGLNLKPEQNENGLPGAKWDVLQTVFSENPDFEEDIISLVHYCAHNKEPNIKESWLFQYADVLPLSQTEAQKEAEDLLVQTAKDYYSSYFRALVALAKCTQMNILYLMGNALGGNAEAPQTVAEVMANFGLSSKSFDGEKGQMFITDLLALMQSDGIELNIAGMDKYIVSGKKATKKWKQFWICIVFAILGIDAISIGGTYIGIALLVVSGVFGVYGFLKKTNKK